MRGAVWTAYPARAGRGPASRWAPPLLVLAAVVLVWLVVARSGSVSPVLLPDPAAVVERLVAWTRSGIIWCYLWPTLGAALLGAGIAVIVGLPLGLLMAHSPALSATIQPLVVFSQTVPLVAVAPLLALWIGYGMVPIAVLCAVISFFPIVTTTLVGLRSLDMRVVEHAVLDGAGWGRRLWHVELPMAAPAILAGVRAGFVLSMTGAIVGEFVMGGAGLGTLLTISRESADTVGVFAVLVWIALVALILQGIIHAAERASERRLQGESQ